MSKKAKSQYSYVPQVEKLPLRSYKTAWDLSLLYYKNEHDPAIEKDLAAAEAAYAAFAKKWQKKDFTKDAKALKQALTDYEALNNEPRVSKPGRYFGFRSVLDTKDAVAEKRLGLMSIRLRKASDQILFFALTLGRLPKATQQKYLKDPSLAHFRYYLERVFLSASHHLTEPEEKIVRLKSGQSYSRWVDAVQKIVSDRTVRWKGKDLPLPEAFETIDLLKAAEKKRLWQLIITELQQIGEFAEHEFNAIITDVRTEDELRGYQKPYSATALGYEDTEKSIENLVHAVSGKGFALSRRFYREKAAYHGVPSLHYTQKYDSIGKDLTIPFQDAVEIARDVFYGVKPLYGEIFDAMLQNGQIDVFPRRGKQGGAFMSAERGHPIHVLLNHVDNFKSLETLAHEMGHAIHAARSSTNSVLYDGHSIVTAETASTLFENLLFDAVYSQATAAQKPILLHDRITRDIATIERQIAFFNCELEIHERIAKEGGMTNDELRATMFTHLHSYLGPAIDLKPEDGYSYVYIPHLRYGFYVYTYAYGILMSTIMANRLKEDPTYIKEIDAFLCAGSSAAVADIFALADIDVSHERVFVEALKNHEADIKEFSRFAAAKRRE